MGRWTFLIPRGVIILLITLAVWLGRDPIIQRGLIEHGQSVTGAKVEIGQARCSFSSGKLFLKNVQIADPRHPMNNFVQADMAYLSLDFPSLADRKFVITDGRASEVVFGAPRTQSGSLNNDNVEAGSLIPKTRSSPNFEMEVRKIGTTWVDQIEPPPTIDDNQSLEVVVLGKKIRSKWQKQLATHRSFVDRINPEISKVKSALTATSTLRNPLRQQEKENLAKQKLAALEKQTDQFLKHLKELDAKVAEDKELLQNARAHDQQNVQQFTTVCEFDGETISQLLLYERQGQLVEEAVQWLRWFRSAVIDPETDLAPTHPRGTNVVFKGVKESPSFLIKKLALEGEGRFAKQHLNFAGTAYNLTTQPRVYPHPAIFELRAQGNQHVIVKCEVDRRGDQPIDRLSIQCPDFELDSEFLGHADSLLVSMGPSSRVQAEVQIELAGDELSGFLSFHHSKVSLHVDQLHRLAGGEETALRINQHLAETNQFKTSVQLDGTLDNYCFTFESDLGPQFASTMTELVNSEFRQKLTDKSRKIDKIYAEEVRVLENSVAPELRQLVMQLNRDASRITELRQSIRVAESDRWDTIR